MLQSEDIFAITCYFVFCLLPIAIAILTKNIAKIPVTTAFIVSNVVLCGVYILIANTDYPLFSVYFLKLDWIQDSFWFLLLSISQLFIFSLAFNYLFFRIDYFQAFQNLLLVKSSQNQKLNRMFSGKSLNILGIFLILMVVAFYLSIKGAGFFSSDGTRFVGFGSDDGKTYTLLNIATLLGSSCLALSASKGKLNVFVMFGLLTFGSLNAMISGERFAAVNFALPYVLLCSVSSKKVAWYVHGIFILLTLSSYSIALVTRGGDVQFFAVVAELLSNLILTPITAIDFSSPLPAMTIAHKISPQPDVQGLISFFVTLMRLLLLLSPLPHPPTLNGFGSFNDYDRSIPEIYNIDVFTELFFSFGWLGTTIYALMAGFIAATLDTIIYRATQARKRDNSLQFSPMFFLVPLSGVWFAGLQNAAPIRSSTRMFVYLITFIIIINFGRRLLIKKSDRKQNM